MVLTSSSHTEMKVEEISDHIEPMHRGGLPAKPVFFSRIVHDVKREVVVLKDLIELGAVLEEHVVVSHSVIDEKRPLEIAGVIEHG